MNKGKLNFIKRISEQLGPEIQVMKEKSPEDLTNSKFKSKEDFLSFTFIVLEKKGRPVA